MSTLGKTIATRSVIERTLTGESPVRPARLAELTKTERKYLDDALAEAPLPSPEDAERLAMNRAEVRSGRHGMVRRILHGKWRKPREDTRPDTVRQAALEADISAAARHRSHGKPAGRPHSKRKING